MERMQIFSRFSILSRMTWSAVAVLAGLPLMEHAKADPAADFYRGKSITMIVGYSSGGGYDIYARAIARHFSKHMAGNPKVVVNNMPGAGSLVSVNYLYNVAPKDGTVVATFGRGLAMEPLIGSAKVQYDPTKLTWLGSASNELSVCAVSARSKAKTFEDTLTSEVAVGGEGSGSDPDTYATLVRNLLGAKMKLVTGYPGGNDMTMAIERGEIDGRCGWSWGSIRATRPQWISGPEKLRVLLQMTLERSPDMPDVPTILEKAKTESDREIVRLIVSRQVVARPFAAPPGVPEDRKKALRKAFDDTMKDPEFLAEAKALTLEVAPISGAEVEKLILALYATSPETVAKAKAVIAPAPGSKKAKH